jgi:hypothetical protein
LPPRARSRQVGQGTVKIGYPIRRGDYEAFLRRRSTIGVITRQLLQGAGATPQIAPA